MDVVMPFAHDDFLAKSHIHSDVATLVDTATRAIQVSQPDRNRLDSSRKSSQGEVDAPPNVVF
jgi:hypothetical protein